MKDQVEALFQAADTNQVRTTCAGEEARGGSGEQGAGSREQGAGGQGLGVCVCGEKGGIRDTERHRAAQRDGVG